jgi:hypothetical protein
MDNSGIPTQSEWNASVYHAECVVECNLATAWEKLLDYVSWNPTFAGAKVVPISGEYRKEGEVVLIKKSISTVSGEPLSAFYAETVKVVPSRRIVWYVYPIEGELFRNFVDFSLAETPTGIKFAISYYEQTHLTEDLLSLQRTELPKIARRVTLAFKQYCEGREPDIEKV